MRLVCTHDFGTHSGGVKEPHDFSWIAPRSTSNEIQTSAWETREHVLLEEGVQTHVRIRLLCEGFERALRRLGQAIVELDQLLQILCSIRFWMLLMNEVGNFDRIEAQ